MKKFLHKLTNIILGLFGVAAAIGLSYTLFPEYFTFLFDTIGMTESQVAMATVVLSGIAVFGSLSKYLRGIVNAQQALSEQQNSLRIRQLEETHNARLSVIQNEKNEETRIYTTVINELIDQQNRNTDLLGYILQVLAITARRNANSTSPLISDEDKELYRQFLEGLNTGEDLVDVENLYTTLTIIEEPEEKEEEIIDPLEERL